MFPRAVVNGRAVTRQEIEADGALRPVEFDYALIDVAEGLVRHRPQQ